VLLPDHGGVKLQNLRNPESFAVLHLVDEADVFNWRNLCQLIAHADSRDKNTAKFGQDPVDDIIQPIFSRLCPEV